MKYVPKFSSTKPPIQYENTACTALTIKYSQQRRCTLQPVHSSCWDTDDVLFSSRLIQRAKLLCAGKKTKQWGKAGDTNGYLYFHFNSTIRNIIADT